MSSDSQLIPFAYSVYKNTPISALEFYGDYVFAGICNNGMVIRSKNRYSWETFYKTSDKNVSALKVFDGYLYVGTSDDGNIYRINLSTMSSETLGRIGSEIVDFVDFNDELYVAVNSPMAIKKLNLSTQGFDFIYEPMAYIYQMITYNDKLYVAMDASNLVSFDGTTWEKILMNDEATNISSYISQEILSRSSTFGSFPINRTNGIKRITSDSTSLVMGSSNYARLYRLTDEKINMIFNTEGSSVNDILNIGTGVNLISTDNKVYLVYTGNLETKLTEQIEVTTTTTTAINPNANKSVIITYPNGGETFVLGETVNIQWSSTKGINDAVKLELVKDNNVISVIESQTANSGLFAWDVPISSVETGGYKIRITWLSAGVADENNVDESDGTFSITRFIATTTTTTTQATDLQTSSPTRGIPILALPEYESVTKMANDLYTNSVLFATSNGRILKCDTLTINGYMTGERLVYADVYDGCGYSGSAQTVFNYALYKKLVELDENKVIKQWKYGSNITAIKSESITAVFQGPIMNIRNDFGFWKELSWEEIKPEGSNVTIYLRSGGSETELLQKSWIYSTSSETGEVGTITRSLYNVGLKGQYLQVKIEMQVDIKDISPSVMNVVLKYSSRNSSYFFTNKFTIDLNTPSEKGLLTATISQPSNTEIHFGIASENTTDWNEYQVITLDRMFDLDNKEMKIGIKFTSYDDSLPNVSEFAVMLGGKSLKELNS